MSFDHTEYLEGSQITPLTDYGKESQTVSKETDLSETHSGSQRGNFGLSISWGHSYNSNECSGGNSRT